MLRSSPTDCERNHRAARRRASRTVTTGFTFSVLSYLSIWILLLAVLLLFSLVIFSFFVVNHDTGFTLVIVVDLFVIAFVVVYLFNVCS